MWQSRIMARHRGEPLVVALNKRISGGQFQWIEGGAGRVAGPIPQGYTAEQLDTMVEWYLRGFTDAAETITTAKTSRLKIQYRTGGTENYKWHDSLPYNNRAEADVALSEVQGQGYTAIIVPLDAPIPTTYAGPFAAIQA